ncbi:unannotated protein [freshwater metagenome]|uniref:Unannotated protein n=1 Tax=freshwater metagenome TaxID=449393 RepID=A0A6J6BFD5_9ZZZZ
MGNHFGTELQDTAFVRVLGDDLNTLPCGISIPVSGVRVGEILPQRRHALRATGKNFGGEVLDKTQVRHSDPEHRDDVPEANRTRKIPPRSRLEEFGRETRVRAKEQARRAINNTSVKVRNRHRWCASRRFAVDLRVVSCDDLGVVASVKLPGHGESRIASNFGDTSALQEVEGMTAGSNEHEFGDNRGRGATNLVTHNHVPQTVLATSNRSNRMIDMNLGLGARDRIDENFCQRTEVNIGAVLKTRRRHRLGLRSTGHDKRRPLVNDLGVIREFRSREKWVIFQRFVAGLEIRNIVGAPHERHVRNGDEK